MGALRLYKTLNKALLAGALFFVVSCNNDIQQVNALTFAADSSLMSGINVEMTRSLKGNINVRMKTPLIKQLLNPENTYEFPNGIDIFMYDSTGNITSQMKADYSIYYDTEGIWEAKNNVDVSNESGERLNTEYLVWNRGKAIIETNQFVKITTKDGIIYGDGLTSDQRFTNWEVVNGRGVFDFDNE